MQSKFTWIFCVLANCLLIYLTQLVNHSLTTFALSLFTLGLTLIFPVLYLPYLQGLITTLITALFFDATQLIGSFGLSYYLLGITFTTAYCIYHHFKLYTPLHTLLLTQFTNLTLLIIYHCVLNYGNGFNLHLIHKIFQVALASKLVLLLITTWFLNLQSSILYQFYPHLSLEKNNSPHPND